MKKLGVAAQLMRHNHQLCPIRRGKKAFFSHWSTSPRPVFLKTRALNGICPIRRGIIPSFYFIGPRRLDPRSCQSEENACNHWADVVID